MSEYPNTYAKFLKEANPTSLFLPEDLLFVVEDHLFNDRMYNRHKGLTINDELYFMKASFMECYTEHISSSFIRECGYSAQQTMMGIYKTYPVVICKDFTDEYGSFEKFGWCSSNCIYEFNLEDLTWHFNIKKNCDVDDCVTKFWEMCLFVWEGMK